MSDTLCAARQGCLDTLGTVCFARMNGERNAQGLCLLEEFGKVRSRIECFGTCQIDGHHSILADILTGQLHRLHVCLVIGITPHTTENQIDRDRTPLRTPYRRLDHLALGQSPIQMQLRSIADFSIDIS